MVIETTDTEKSPAPVKKKVGINEPQTCRNKGCGKTFKEKDNHETACEYHPGPAVFHDRLRGVGSVAFSVVGSTSQSSNHH